MFELKQNEPHQINTIDSIVDDHGFLTDPDKWTEAFAASALGLMPYSLSSQHKDVIHYVRKKYLQYSGLPPARDICNSIGMEESMLIVLFGSCLQLWRASGLPRPDDEIGSHLN